MLYHNSKQWIREDPRVNRAMDRHGVVILASQRLSRTGVR
jgi:hypothetical protein